jgi:putative transposase
MPKRQVPLLSGNFYHVYNRGVNKGLVFFSDRNYQFFIDRMLKYLRPNSEIIAFCLMPNHYHLLIKVESDKYMDESLRPLIVSYSKAVNNEQDRTGPLFQGRYQSILIEDDEYLLDCVKYIHLNPVKAHLVSSPEKWKHSSYLNYIGKGVTAFINTSIVLSFFDNLTEFREFSEIGIDDYESKFFKEM